MKDIQEAMPARLPKKARAVFSNNEKTFPSFIYFPFRRVTILSAV